MVNDERKNDDIIDEDLYEEIDDEELYQLVQEERKKALAKQKQEPQKPKRPFPKWAFWLIAIAMFIQVIAIIPNTFSIPAIDFLVTSAKLSTNPMIDEYQKSVVVVEADSSRGTGFSISADGTIITNHHVIEDAMSLLVAFPDEGLYEAEVVASYPDVDLAVLDVEGENLPHLQLAEETTFDESEHIYFIGNPLRFQGIANEGKIIGYTELSNWQQPVLMLRAPIYRGNSGSPVINTEGEVIAVVFATQNNEAEGRVGLAVPIDYYYENHGDQE